MAGFNLPPGCSLATIERYVGDDDEQCLYSEPDDPRYDTLPSVREIAANNGLLSDKDELPPLVIKRCPECHCMIEDFVEHRCSR
jgi:hypothetical protein